MFLALDIGNSNLTFGLFRGPRLLRTWRLETKPGATPGMLAWQFARLPKLPAASLEVMAAASVVPELEAAVTAAAKQVWNHEVAWIRAESPWPIRNLYRPAGTAGVDRLLNAVAVSEYHGLPALVVDFGTAITVDAVSGKGEFLGGAILPGIHVGLTALASKTSKIRTVALAKPRRIIGKSTREGLNSGLVLGTGFAVQSLLLGMKREMAGKARVVATGGYAAWLAPLCPAIGAVDPDLTLQGIRLAWEYQKRIQP